MKNSLQDYTEQEFLDELTKILDDDDKYDPSLIDDLVEYFNTKIAHPSGSALITHPSHVGIDDTTDAIISEIKRWYAEQGLECFKNR